MTRKVRSEVMVVTVNCIQKRITPQETAEQHS